MRHLLAGHQELCNYNCLEQPAYVCFKEKYKTTIILRLLRYFFLIQTRFEQLLTGIPIIQNRKKNSFSLVRKFKKSKQFINMGQSLSQTTKSPLAIIILIKRGETKQKMVFRWKHCACVLSKQIGQVRQPHAHAYKTKMCKIVDNELRIRSPSITRITTFQSQINLNVQLIGGLFRYTSPFRKHTN